MTCKCYNKWVSCKPLQHEQVQNMYRPTTSMTASAKSSLNATSAELEQMWWHGSWDTTLHIMMRKETIRKKKITVAKHDKTASSIISQSEHINRREHTLCHALVSVRQSTDMQAVLLSLSLSLLPCKHRLFLIFQFLGLHDNKIIPCRKHWSGSEGNTKGSAHKASQCSQCTLLRRQTTSST